MTVKSQNDPGFYREGGWQYDSAREQSWLTRNIITPYSLEPGMTLLDLGCGDGLHARLFARKGLVVTGIDSTAEAIEVAIENAVADERIDVAPKFRVHDVMDDADLGIFDVVFCRGLPQYPLTDRAAHIMAAARRSLRPEGLAFILRASDGSGEDSDGSLPGSRMSNPTLADWEKMVDTAGFEILESAQKKHIIFVAARNP